MSCTSAAATPAVVLSTGFAPRDLTAGEHTLTLTCTQPGAFGFDYLWYR
jgi:hypothetical protein